MGRNTEFSTKEGNKIPQQVRNDKIRLSFLRMQESSVSRTVSKNLRFDKKIPPLSWEYEEKCYTRIFVTFSPNRSFFFVIFLLVRANPKIATQKPKKPIQKSVSTEGIDITPLS